MTSAPKAASGKRVLVTGASGFVGRRLMPRLADDGHEAIGLTGPEAEPGPLRVDLTDRAATQAAFAHLRPDVVVHLAAMSSVGVGSSQPDEVWRANFDGARSVALACRALEQDVRLIFASSGEVYGRRFNEGPCDEAAPIAPMSAYARSKAASEFELEDIARCGLTVTALRLFNHTGPGQDQRFVAPSFAAQIAAAAKAGGGQIRVGNLDAMRDFSDVDDVIGAYVAVISDVERPAAPFEVFNVGSGRARAVRELLDALIAISAANVEVVSDPDRMRPSDIARAEGRFEKIAARHGWRATTPLETTLASLYAWWRDRV
ncbi:MAG: GDP-mannose 4,6-dehydratase [Caulobacteraceae bacterium]|nr:GDP-mannose 4,6-dehydratase [Caulobacteraceae bacterium]